MKDEIIDINGWEGLRANGREWKKAWEGIGEREKEWEKVE